MTFIVSPVSKKQIFNITIYFGQNSQPCCGILVSDLNRELQGLRNIENQRLEILRSRHRDTYTALMWLRENKHMFQATVHEPIMLCVRYQSRGLEKTCVVLSWVGLRLKVFSPVCPMDSSATVNHDHL